MNPNWPRYLTKQSRNAKANSDRDLANRVQAAERTLHAISLFESSDATKVMSQVTSSFFGQEDVESADCIRLAQIAATLSVQAADGFEFVTRGGKRSSRKQTFPLIADSRSELDLFAAETWCNQHVLHGDYWTEFRSCTEEEWKQWLASGRSGLQEFFPLKPKNHKLDAEYKLTNLLKQRGHDGNIDLPFVTSDFIIEDWDFPEEHWRYWETLARSDKQFWSKLLKRILEQPPSFWKNALEASAQQVATTGRCRALATPGLLPDWILKFRQCKCLQDTHGTLREPVELLCRTAATESLLDVDPFIRADLDTEAVRPLLLRLGVRDTPTGPDRLIDRLKALSTVKNPPVFEVQKWCHRLDGMLPKCSTEEFQKIKTAFRMQNLILTANGTWAKVNEVFLSPDDHDLPGAAIVHDALRSLTMWQKIGVKEWPTLELVLAWLQSLPKNQKLIPEELRRVRDLLSRHPHRIWFDCDCWLNLDGEWIDVADLRYSISMHSLSAWAHLFPSVKKQVADFQRLSADVVHEKPFSGLPSLASCLEERVQSNLFSPSAPVAKPWLAALGTGLSRIVTDSDEKTRSIRDNAIRLAQTAWQTTTVLETVPYLDGTPAGTARQNEVLWDGRVLFVVDRPIMQMLRQIAKELARTFDDPEIEDAIKFCINRPAEHVSEYLEQNFTLSESGEVAGVNDSHPEAPAVAIDDNQTGPVINDLPEGDDLEMADVDSATEDDPVSEDELVESDQSETETRPPPTRNPKHRPKSLPLIERYALARGFKRESNGDRFFHADGRRLLNQSGQSFQWEMFSAEGQLLRAILVREHCLEREPLQMRSEVWEAYRKTPDTHSLLVTDNEGIPQELSGGDLLRMVNDNTLVLYPASYRIVCSVEEVLIDDTSD